MTPIMNVFNEWYAAITSKKIRAVIEANAKAGKYRSGQAPYGSISHLGEEKQNGICQSSVRSCILRGLRDENAHQV